MPRIPNMSRQTRCLLELLVGEPEAWQYGYDLSRRTGLKSGTLYPILMRLADQGWLATRWAEPLGSGRPPRHMYRLTEEGARQAAAILSAASRPRATLLPRPGVVGA
jgi:PadR family transcriptional regulator PadR